MNNSTYFLHYDEKQEGTPVLTLIHDYDMDWPW